MLLIRSGGRDGVGAGHESFQTLIGDLFCFFRGGRRGGGGDRIRGDAFREDVGVGDWTRTILFGDMCTRLRKRKPPSLAVTH